MTRAAAVSLRVADANDALCIAVAGTQVFLDTYAPDGIRPTLAREVLDHFSTAAVAALLRDPATTFVVAESSGHLLGFVQWTRGATIYRFQDEQYENRVLARALDAKGRSAIAFDGAYTRK